MSALATLKEAAKCGVRVSLNGDSLALKAGTKPPPDLLAKLRTHKAEVVALLRKEACAARPTEPDLVELEERMGMAMDSVPEPYLDAWRRLKCQRPMAVSDLAWRQAIYVAGRLFDAFTIRFSSNSSDAGRHSRRAQSLSRMHSGRRGSAL
jgi:hypothetical protein